VTTTLPFPALVGLELAQQALILLAIEPRLRGVVLSAPAGTGKSSLARGIRDVLDDDDAPFIELPPSVDAENLLGGLDLEATLRTGDLVMQRGILAKADGGVVYVDGINLLTDATTNLLLSVVDNGVVNLEREGVSLRDAAHFSLIGSYDPAEGMPRKHLIDRLGLIASLPGQLSASDRATVLRRNLHQARTTWAEDTQFLRGLILAAREQLPQVTISDAQIEQLSLLALQYGVEGHRADNFAVMTACASAAADLRDEVNEDDMKTAMQLVILPRATQIPAPPPEDDAPPPQQQPQEPEADAQAPDDPPPPTDSDETDDDTEQAAPPDELMPPPDEILEALTGELPDDLEELPFQNLRRGKTGSRGATEAKRGRHIRSVPGNPTQGRIDVVSTLRSAAPWQQLRQRANPDDDRRVQLELSDVRVKKYRNKAGALFCFLVDASGSMALHRMRQAKGAVHTLLEKAYVKRDRVALIAFRGDQAELLMPPTQSVELAKRALDLLPTGGGTPLASALISAGDVAQQARMRGIMQTVAVVLTDGRGNIPFTAGNDPQEELQQLAGYVQDCGMHVMIVDTKRSYLSKGEARQLAEWLGADYAYLPNATGEEIGELAANVRD
jgi:magnesium chelatase subunit D